MLPGSETKYIKRFLKVDPMGEITNPSDLEAALQGVDTVVHMAYEVDPSKTREDMYEVNVAGAQRLLDGAEAAGVPRVVASSSALTLGVHRDPVPLDEEAEWAIHGIDLDYVESRREAEQLALSRSRPGFEVVVVAPALTIGPEDFGPAPGGKIIKRVVEGRFVPTFDVGVGCVDARDFADGVLLAAERGRPGQRYVLCAHNPTLKDRVVEVAAVAGTRARTWHLPRFLPRVLAAVLVFLVPDPGKERAAPHCEAWAAHRPSRLVRRPPNARRPRLATEAPARDPRRHSAVVSGEPQALACCRSVEGTGLFQIA